MSTIPPIKGRAPARRPQNWQFLLAAAVLLLPFFTVVGRALHEAVKVPSELQKQKLGLTLVAHIEAVLFDVQVLRVTSIALSEADPSLANRYGEAEEKSIQTDLGIVDQDMDGQVGIQDTWKATESVIHATVDGASKFHPAQSLSNFDDATKKLCTFLDTATDVYHISLDPSTARSTQLLLLTADVACRMGRVCELTAAASALGQSIDVDDRTELIQLMSLLDHDEVAAESLYQKMQSENLNIGPRLDTGHKALKAACDSFIEYIQKGIIENGGDKVTNLHSKLSSELDFLTEFYQALAPCQVDLLTDREKKLQKDGVDYAWDNGALAIEAALVALLIAYIVVR